MNRFVLSLVFAASILHGAAYDAGPTFQQLITIAGSRGMPQSSIVYRCARNDRKRIFAVLVCHQESAFAENASRDGANYASKNQGHTIQKIWQEILKNLKDKESCPDKTALLIGLFEFRRKLNVCKGALHTWQFKGDLFFPQSGEVIELRNELGDHLSYPIPLGEPMHMCRIDIDYAVFKAVKP